MVNLIKRIELLLESVTKVKKLKITGTGKLCWLVIHDLFEMQNFKLLIKELIIALPSN